MRLKKGSKVEVMSKEEVATGCWHCAEIISGNGRTYTVKYDWFPVMTMAVVKKVPRKGIRPCPPPVEGLDNWVPGDLVEVFHNLSWKTATVKKVMIGNYFMVRLLGLSKEFEVHKSYLRVRQSWEKGAWFVVGQSGGSTADGGFKYPEWPLHAKVLKVRTDTDMNPPKTPLMWDQHRGSGNSLSNSTRKRKGSPYRLSHIESCNVVSQKVRVIEKDCSRQRIFLKNVSQVSDKVDAFVSQQELLGEKCVRSFINNGRNDLYRKEVGRGDDSFISGTSIPLDTESCGSSVGSCSANSNVVHNLPFCFREHDREDTSLCSDAESFCGRGYEEEECLLPINEKSMSEVGSDAESYFAREHEEEDYPLPINEKLVAGSHRSELLTYRCAIEALYASGPLTWEEELRMSNLRHSLRISDDEHLSELKNLIST